MKKLIYIFSPFLLAFLLNSLCCLGQSMELSREVNVIYGDQHIFTIQTPEGWVKDQKIASKMKLASIFYPETDAEKDKKSYIYAMGYDKNRKATDLNAFIKADLASVQENNPELTYHAEKVDTVAGTRQVSVYSLENLSEQYRKQVVYMETEHSILVFHFSARNKKDYHNYQGLFGQFVSSFNFRGHNPEPYLHWLEKRS